MNGLVEIWDDFILLLNEIYPLLKPLDKVSCIGFKGWAILNKNRHSGLLVVNINKASSWLDRIRYYLPDEVQEKMAEAICFIESLNGYPAPDLFQTKAGCEFWGHYWWDGGCHQDVKPPPPEPPEPPPVLRCSDYTNQTACLGVGCYWWDGACHDQDKPKPPEFKCSDYTLAKACLNAGCYWWDNACHADPEPSLPEKPCSDYTNQTACLTAGCYWYDNSCHDQPKVPPIGPTDPLQELAKQIREYCATIPLTMPVRRANCFILSGILRILSDFFDWQRRL